MDDLALVLNLLSEVLVLLSERLDLIFSLKQSSLVIVFLGRDDGHLVLHVAEFDHLLLQILLGLLQLSSLVVQLCLDLVYVGV